jgi:cell fate (sporulation/competence/biofilm development) regulator YmcA (YheA/YmcA/DUF963 family)
MTPIDRMKAKAETDAAIDRIESLVRNARAVPLTDQVRLNLKEAKQLISELRDTVSAERRAGRG